MSSLLRQKKSLVYNISENKNVQHDNMKNVSRGHIARSNEILGWGGVGNRQLLCF
jgi:hypothetical protein